MADKPTINKVSVSFAQEGNTLGTTEEYEQIDINLEFQLDEDDGAFVVIKTDGWSMNEPEDLIPLVNRVKQILNK